MKLSPLGLAILCFCEEFKATGYYDSGHVPTAGYGHTGADVQVGDTYTLTRGAEWLAQDVSWAEAAVDSHVKKALNQRQFDALVLFAYNVGATAFEKSTLLTFLNEGLNSDAATQFLIWDKVRGVENDGLERRRSIEKALFLS